MEADKNKPTRALSGYCSEEVNIHFQRQYFELTEKHCAEFTTKGGK